MRKRAFLREEAGTFAPLFALSLVPIITIAGMTIDLANLTRAKNELQLAVDSTALAINHKLHLATQAALDSKAQIFFSGHVHNLEEPQLDPVAFDVQTGSVEVSGSATYTPRILNALGFGPLDFSARAKTVVGDQEIELALVLDNSGSMDSSDKIEALEAAAESLVDTLYSNENAHTRIRVGVVPFAGSVNVGPGNADATWMDTDAKSSIHSENFVTPANRFTLFSEMIDTSWAGCVEMRPGDYATNDAEPDQDIGDSLFVPMFAPDEPYNFTNNYIGDDGSCTNEEKQETDNASKQSRICKYKNQKPAARSVVSGEQVTGPNFWCTSKPIVPLTNDVEILAEALDGMVAKGHTNIYEGLMWGWRVLSPGAPFEEGKDYNTPNLRKYIVLMTDGENTAVGKSNYNKSEYSPFGYSAKGRLGTTSSYSSTIESKMDDKLKDACKNAKQAGITIYTIAFKLPSNATATKAMLANCASSTDKAFTPEENSELEPVFQAIAKDLGKLRISE